MKAIKLKNKSPYIPSPDLITRLENAYEYLIANQVDDKSTLWNMITDKNIDIHLALRRKDGSSRQLLSNPSQTNLYYGVDNLAIDIVNRIPEESTSEFDRIHTLLIQLGEATGRLNIHNPEQMGTRGRKETPELEFVLNRLSAGEGNFKFPNPFDGEFGIVTDYGLISYRSIHAYYQAQILIRICKHTKTSNILEIGAGMGRTAYYAYLHGMNYSIVDLPIGLIGQALFLAATLGEDSFSFQNEPFTNRRNIRLMTQDQFEHSEKKYDIILNVDSLTEMSEQTATDYVKKISEKANLFLSINHDVNDFSVAQIIEGQRNYKLIYRSPYWIRGGVLRGTLFISRFKQWTQEPMEKLEIFQYDYTF